MAFILHIETATEHCSVALSAHDQLLHAITVSEGFKHNENLIEFILNVLKAAKMQLHQLDAIAVSAGPGSYTGLRIGVSTAKGLCFALGIPLIGIDTLEIVARSYAASNLKKAIVLLPMIDARRMEVYAGLYDLNFDLIDFRAPLIVNEDLANALAKNELEIHYFGNGAEKCIPIFNTKEKLVFAGNIAPDARYMVSSALKKFTAQQFEDLAYFEPEYLKPFYTTHPTLR